VIDYVLGDEEIREKVISLKVGERTDSDHQPVMVIKDNKMGGHDRKGKWEGEEKNLE